METYQTRSSIYEGRRLICAGVGCTRKDGRIRRGERIWCLPQAGGVLYEALCTACYEALGEAEVQRRWRRYHRTGEYADAVMPQTESLQAAV